MSFAIFLGLNDFSDKIEKPFVGAGGGITRPYKSIFGGGPGRGPPLKINLPPLQIVFQFCLENYLILKQ